MSAIALGIPENHGSALHPFAVIDGHLGTPDLTDRFREVASIAEMTAIGREAAVSCPLNGRVDKQGLPPKSGQAASYPIARIGGSKTNDGFWEHRSTNRTTYIEAHSRRRKPR